MEMRAEIEMGTGCILNLLLAGDDEQSIEILYGSLLRITRHYPGHARSPSMLFF